MKRHSNILSAEAGLVAALVIVITTFSMDVCSDAPTSSRGHQRSSEPITLVDLPPTVHRVEVVPDIPRPSDLLPPEEEPNLFRVIADDLPNLPELPERTGNGSTPAPPALQPPPIAYQEPRYEEPPFVDFAEVMPELIGGIEALQASITYPEFARRSGVAGRVILQFIVNTDGSVSDAIVVRGIGGGCDEAALEAIRNTRFTPGLQRGRPVRVRMALPITFRLH